MKYLALALILLVGISYAHTVAINLDARIGVNDTIRVNDTWLNVTSAGTFPALEKNYVSINRSNVLVSIVSPAAVSSSINGSYYRDKSDGSSLITLHLDNSTTPGEINGIVACNVAGKVDGSCIFGGGYINFSKLDIEGFKNYTIAAWVKTNADGGIFSQSDGSPNHVISLRVANGTARFATSEGSAANVDGSTVTDNAWHHVAAVKNGTAGAIYVDGELKATGAVALVSSTNDSRLGTLQNGASPFSGNIDEFYAFGRPLSPTEIGELYENNPHYSAVRLAGSEKYLIAATNGTYNDIEGKLAMLGKNGIISATFGNFLNLNPANYNIVLRLEYAQIDIQNKIDWSGTGSLIIKNMGLNSVGLPIVRLEVIR